MAKKQVITRPMSIGEYSHLLRCLNSIGIISAEGVNGKSATEFVRVKVTFKSRLDFEDRVMLNKMFSVKYGSKLLLEKVSPISYSISKLA